MGSLSKSLIHCDHATETKWENTRYVSFFKTLDFGFTLNSLPGLSISEEKCSIVLNNIFKWQS